MLFTGCVTAKRCNARFPPQVISDSIYIEKLKEVPVYIDGDTITIKVPANCPDQEVAVYENVKLRQTIRILNGKLSSVTMLKPDTVKVFLKDTETKIKEVKVPQPIRYTPKFILYSAIVTWVLIVLVILWLLNKVFKIIRV